MIEKTCVVCEKQFRVSPSHEAQKFCSWDCKKTASNVGMTCQHCGKGFTVPLSRLNSGGPVRFCSKQCKDASLVNPDAKNSRYREKKKPVGLVAVTCQVCGKSFDCFPSRAKNAKTCSSACGYKLRGLTNSKEKVILRCEQCGTEIAEHASHADRRRFCSHRCKELSDAYRQEASERVSGSGNPAWVGGFTEHADGYIYIRLSKHPFASNGYVFEHRLVIEKAMREQAPHHPFLVDVGGEKYLRQGVHVHHVDEDRKNNSPANLMAVTPEAHRRIHESGKAPEPWEFWKPTL
jgi:endogenous inhibitor of DNA gyrase (YacG/DUF329 family)